MNMSHFLERFTTKEIITTAAAGFFSFLFLNIIARYNRSRRLKNKLNSQRLQALTVRNEKIDKFIEKYGKKVTEKNKALIINADVTKLSRMIRNKEVTCVDVLITYAIRAGTIGKDLNLIADVDFEGALALSIIADEEIKSGKKLGDLHGIPVSFYEMISVKGILTTCGYSSYFNNINKTDSLFVTILKKNGAIPFLKSNIPQGFMSLEASNFLWGKAKNPWNSNKTAGGSNGGEAGLVAARCSPFGIGSDLFGSIRLPVNFCGVYGFKPTSTRNSKQGGISYNGTNFVGFNPVFTSWGPICRSADDILLISRCLFGKFEEDPYVDNRPFNEENYSFLENTKKVRIAYVKKLTDISIAPCILEIMDDVIEKLRQTGYELIEILPDVYEELIDVGIILFCNSETIELINRELDGEPLETYHETLYMLRTKPNWYLNIAAYFKSLSGDERISKFLKSVKKINTSEYIDYTRRFINLRNEFIKFWKTQEFSAIISPVFPTPALDFGVSQMFLPVNHLAFLHNFVDLPSVALPIKINTNTKSSYSNNSQLSRIMETNVKNSENLPLGIQIGALSNEDEKALRLLKVINDIYRFDENYSNKIFEVIH